MNVYPRMFTMLRTTAIPGSVLVNISPFYYLKDGAYVVYGGGTFNLTPYIPTTQNNTRLVLVGLDTDTNTITAYAGPESFDSALTPPLPPTGISSTFLPSALIRVPYGAVEVTELQISDARVFFGLSGGVSWPLDKVKTVSTTSLYADFTSLEDALAAAVANNWSGYTIVLDSETYTLTTTQPLGLSLTIVGQGPEATQVISTANNAAAFDLTTDGTTITFRNLTLENSGGGSISAVLFSNNNVNVLLDNCVIRIDSGAPTAAYGIWAEGGEWTLQNSSKIDIQNAGYGILNDAGTVVVHVGAGCELNGGTTDIYSNQSGSTVYLDGCVLTNALLSWAGTLKGSFLTGVGVLVPQSGIKGLGSVFPSLGTTTAAEKWGHVYLAQAKDIFPDDDRRGLATRFIAPFGYSDHFRSGSIPTNYAWAAASGYFSGTPTILSYNYNSEYLFALATAGGNVHFMGKAISNSGSAWDSKYIMARVCPSGAGSAGLRVDNGNSATNQPYVEIYVTDNANGTMTLYFAYKNTVGGGVTTTTLSTIPIGFVTIMLFIAGSTTYLGQAYISTEAGTNVYLAQSATNASWIPSAGRAGITVRGANNWQVFDFILNNFG